MEIPDRANQKKQIQQHKTNEMRQKWRKHFEKLENTAYEEACMHNVADVAGIAWIPANPFRPLLKDQNTGKLLGKYVLQVQRLDKMVNNDYATCPTFKVHPDTAWVEDIFNPEYLATAQKFAIDY